MLAALAFGYLQKPLYGVRRAFLFALNVLPRRGMEDSRMLWLEAPNPFVAERVSVQALIEQIPRPHTALLVRACIGWRS